MYIPNGEPTANLDTLDSGPTGEVPMAPSMKVRKRELAALVDNRREHDGQ
jgi:hypothetical protein